MVKVIDTGSISINAVDYKLVGQVQPQMITQFPPKILIGEGGRQDQSIRSTWEISDLTGGVGILDMNESEHPTRFYDGYAWTLDRKKIHLPPLQTQLGDAMGMAVYNYVWYATNLYAVGATAVKRYNTSTSVWDSVLTSGNIFLDGLDWTNAAGTQRLYVTQLAAYHYSTSGDSASWTTVAKSMGYLTVFDGKMISVDDSDLEYTEDGTTWTTILTHNKGVPYGLKTIRTNDGREEVIVVVWPDGVYYVDFWTGKMYKVVDLSSQRYEYNGYHMLAHRDELFIPSMYQLLRISGTTVTNIGLRKSDDVWPYDSRIIALTTVGDYIIAGTNRHVLVWNGKGWHPMLDLGSDSTLLSAMITDSVILQSSSTIKVYYAWKTGSTWTTRYIEFPTSGLRPTDYSSYKYAAAGYIYSPYFDAGFPEWDKVAVSLELTCSDMTADEVIVVQYRLNAATSWTAFGTVTGNGVTKITFNNGSSQPVGVGFKKIQFEFALARGTTNTKTPKLEAAVLRFYRTPDIIMGYRCTIDCSKEYKSRTPGEQIAALETAAAADEMVVMSYRPNDDKYVKVMSLAGSESSGHRRAGIYTLTLAEMD